MAAVPHQSFRSFGIIPAAGLSRRMGRPKLIMPWGHSTVIEHVVAAWRRSGVDDVVAVVKADDTELRALCEAAGAMVVSPVPPPPEMKDSVMAAVDAITGQFQPNDDAVWLLAPADMPRLASAVIDALLAAHDVAEPTILVPTHRLPAASQAGATPASKRGHPVLFPWPLAAKLVTLGDDAGVNALLKRWPVREVAVEQSSILDDLDTLDDYRRLSNDDG